jgi:hypothetical protein
VRSPVGVGIGDACDPTDDDGDFDRNGAINGDDIQGFVGCFVGGISAGPCAAADMDDDGDLDDQDVREFVCGLLGLPPTCTP